jgi:formylmethanofuran dehydrogenase subunit C
MPLVLTLRTSTSIPIEVEEVLPDACAGRSLGEIERLMVFHGKQRLPLGEFFQITGSCDDGELVFRGNCRCVHWIGAKMGHGKIRVEGNAGRHLGSQMTGGEIRVEGDCGDWLGAEMRGGRIDVGGRVGHQLGAAYRGSPRGMRGGEILVYGDAGNEIGARMRRGLIAVGGRSGDAPGYAMQAGTILLFGEGGNRPGANMKRGTIAFFSRTPPQVLPTFRRGAALEPSFMNVLLRTLHRRGFLIEAQSLGAKFEHFSGDMLEGGRGEVLIASS